MSTFLEKLLAGRGDCHLKSEVCITPGHFLNSAKNHKILKMLSIENDLAQKVNYEKAKQIAIKQFSEKLEKLCFNIINISSSSYRVRCWGSG